MDIRQLSTDGLETAAKYLKRIDEMLDKDYEGSVKVNDDGSVVASGLDDKERIVAIKAGTEILKTVWDRTLPKLSANKNTNIDVDANMLKTLLKFPPSLLLQMKEHVDFKEPKHVESESRPCH